MAVYRRLCQSLWSWSFKYQKQAFCVKLQNEEFGLHNEDKKILADGSRKTFSIKNIMKTHSDLYNKILKEDQSNTDWESIREDILRIPQITNMTIDSTIMDLCMLGSQVDKAEKYFKFLKERNYPLHMAIIGKYLRLFFLKNQQCNLTDADKQEIVAICDDLMKKYPCLDWITAQNCIVGLCLTDQWEKSFEILDMLIVSTTPTSTVYWALAYAAFLHNKPDIGWDMMQQVASRRAIPWNNTYTSYLQYCQHGGRELFDDRLEKMFAFWADNDMKPYNSVLDEYAAVAGEYGWSAAITNITMGGHCAKCHGWLSNLKFSQGTFRELVDVFMRKVIIDENIYFKSHPQELRKFTEFINRTKPYDVVIDGLNVTYIGRKKAIEKSETLAKVVEHFVKRGKKVLVLTRKHQKRLSTLKYIQQNALIFWVDNLSIDDPYLLYATLVSGDKAIFVSSDLMRQHKSLLEDKRLQMVFKKWQCSHQHFVKIKNSHVLIVQPFKFMPYSQKNGNSWHIPYIGNDSTNPDTYEFPDKWYCFHKIV